MFQTGKTAQVEREMLLYRIDILGISECRWTGNGSVTTSLGNTIIYSGRMQDILAPEDHKQGTLSKDRTTGHHHGSKAKKMEMAWACYQERPR